MITSSFSKVVVEESFEQFCQDNARDIVIWQAFIAHLSPEDILHAYILWCLTVGVASTTVAACIMQKCPLTPVQSLCESSHEADELMTGNLHVYGDSVVLIGMSEANSSVVNEMFNF